MFPSFQWTDFAGFKFQWTRCRNKWVVKQRSWKGAKPAMKISCQIRGCISMHLYHTTVGFGQNSSQQLTLLMTEDWQSTSHLQVFTQPPLSFWCMMSEKWQPKCWSTNQPNGDWATAPGARPLFFFSSLMPREAELAPEICQWGLAFPRNLLDPSTGFILLCSQPCGHASSFSRSVGWIKLKLDWKYRQCDVYITNRLRFGTTSVSAVNTSFPTEFQPL